MGDAIIGASMIGWPITSIAPESQQVTGAGSGQQVGAGGGQQAGAGAGTTQQVTVPQLC
ncbi:hypothetical protein N9N28_17985 [Rubripirellula amarantea]|nr:hypothetical protein [Rubripirellula amarantea]